MLLCFRRPDRRTGASTLDGDADEPVRPSTPLDRVYGFGGVSAPVPVTLTAEGVRGRPRPYVGERPGPYGRAFAGLGCQRSV